jgi:CHAT domain-containing protein
LLIEPITPLIRSYHRLVFVPDIRIASLPFAALRAQDGRFLIETHAVSSSPSAAVFLRIRKRERTTAPQNVLVVAGSAGDLPEVGREARAVARQYPASDVLAGSRAATSEFLRTAPDADVVHFAGHGTAAGDDASTSLVLNGHGEALDRGEIEALSLTHTDVVVLAACNTARGETRWTEGTLSVARSFMAAGAPSVIATLWPIDDRDAAAFFPRLHARLAAGVPPAQALRATQLEAIHRPGSSPALWAAVQLVGR